jgi:hypothetical protein
MNDLVSCSHLPNQAKRNLFWTLFSCDMFYTKGNENHGAGTTTAGANVGQVSGCPAVKLVNSLPWQLNPPGATRFGLW